MSLASGPRMSSKTLSSSFWAAANNVLPASSAEWKVRWPCCCANEYGTYPANSRANATNAMAAANSRARDLPGETSLFFIILLLHQKCRRWIREANGDRLRHETLLCQSSTARERKSLGHFRHDQSH